ncbi:MAG: AraC family transcriptional regulator [Armatimonadota bacterium]
MRIRHQESIFEDIYEGAIKDVPFKLVYFGNVRHRQGNAILAHVHGYFEMCILVDGSVEYSVDNCIYRMNVGDVCLTKPGEMHSMTGIGNIEWEVYYAAFEKLGIPELDVILNHSNIPAVKACADMLPDFTKIISTAGIPGHGMMHVSHLLLNALLIDLVNRMGQSISTEESCCSSSVVDEARDYIERNARHKLSLDEISHAVGLSKSRLAHRFSEEMNTPIYHYVRRILMQRSLRLLEDGKMNISEIADALDFPSIYCFSSSFKRYWGYSPSDYRKKLNSKTHPV